MQLLEGGYVYSATDLNNYLECEQLVALERRVAQRLLARPQERDQTAELIRAKGVEHEMRRLEAYVAEYGDAVVSFTERPQNSRSGLMAAEAQTIAAMARSARIMYQATFFDGDFVGHADFLRRIDVPSQRWPWSYEVIDTKLALSPKPYFLIQLCNYSEHLERVQGSAPQHGYIVLGSGDERAFRIAHYAAYYRHLKQSFLAAVASLDDAYPLEVPHCSVCAWSDACSQRPEADDHLSLVAGLRVGQMDKLEDAGITTMTGLATAAERPWRMSERTFEDLRTQAELQVEQRRARARGDRMPYRYRFRPDPIVDEATTQKVTAGFAKLPEPARGDIFFDIEGDPLYRPDRGLEYLFGLYVPDDDRYVAFWAKESDEERLAFERCVDFIAERLARYPDLHVYHYAAYEKSALRRLMGGFASREREIDDFLTLGLFVDLYPVVHQAMWISQPSYSLKKVEAFYVQKRSTKTKGGDDSIVVFEMWLASQDPALLEDIERYNEDDCRSTYRLREWLVTLRAEYNARRETPLQWRSPVESPQEKPEPPRTELERELLGGLAAPDSLAALRAAPPEFRARWLLGNVIQYHRRENKPEYWQYFERWKTSKASLSSTATPSGACGDASTLRRINSAPGSIPFTRTSIRPRSTICAATSRTVRIRERASRRSSSTTKPRGRFASSSARRWRRACGRSFPANRSHMPAGKPPSSESRARISTAASRTTTRQRWRCCGCAAPFIRPFRRRAPSTEDRRRRVADTNYPCTRRLLSLRTRAAGFRKVDVGRGGDRRTAASEPARRHHGQQPQSAA